MAQSPTISIPKKSTDEVDWTTPIRNIIAQSYGENPDNYASECAALQRCRQDAVRGAGSDLTASSLLTKYFGQLELLELRFSEIRVSFPWRDAFTSKLTTQTSLAFEKASIIFQIAATHSSIANSQNRSDPEGLKRAYYYFRTCAGMLTYINDNFLHAPSTDLSREVVKFLVGITMAQANETFYETCVDQRKTPSLVAKIASHTAFLYAGLVEEVKEFMGKGIFDRNWVTLLQIKAKYFASLTQYHRSLADTTANKHGEALARLAVAESNAKEAHRMASSFSPYFVTTLSPTLPSDTGQAILDMTKAHLALCTEKKTQGQKDNDLIYNAHVPSEATLTAVDKIAAATPIPIQEVYGTPEVQKTIGPDLFAKLIPLSVHESASVYSEEKAKIVRAEVEKAENIEGEIRVGLESLGVKAGLGRFKEIAEGAVDDGVPPTVTAWQEEVRRKERVEGVEGLLKRLDGLKTDVKTQLDSTARDLDAETRECESMRVKYEHLWTQEPSAGPAKSLRRDLKSHLSSLDAAAPSDQQIYALWGSLKGDIELLLSGRLEGMFAAVVAGGQGNLLEVEPTADDDERAAISKVVDEIEERLGKLNKITHERGEVLRDLKEKVQNDDVSHLLLINRRNTGVEPTLFATELEKFRPYQSRLAATIHAQQVTIQEIAQLWRTLKMKGGSGKGVKRWEERQKQINDLTKRFALAREGYLEARDGIQKGLQFYKDLNGLTEDSRKNVRAFVNARTKERETLSSRLNIEQRLNESASTAPSQPPALPPPPPRPLEASFASMSIGAPTNTPSPSSWQRSSLPPAVPPPPVASPYSQPQQPPPQRSYTLGHPPPGTPSSPYGSQPQPQHSKLPPPPQAPQQNASYGALPPPPPPHAPPAASNPYADMFSGMALSSAFSMSSAPSPPAPVPNAFNQYSHQPSAPPPPSQPQYQTSQNQPQWNGYPQPQPPQHPSPYPPPPPQHQPYNPGAPSQHNPYGQPQPAPQQQQYGQYSSPPHPQQYASFPPQPPGSYQYP